MKIKTATGIIKLYMKLCGFKGWASLWDTVYIMPGWEYNQALIRHEQMHIKQMERYGKVMFMVKYTYWFIRFGYRNHPLEAEARAAEITRTTQ